MLDQTQLHRIQDPEIRRIVQLLANHLEQALNDLDTLRAENQRLKDEINRLKGEQGKPNVKPNKKTDTDQDPTDHSSEEQRKQRKPWSKDTKNDKIVIDRSEIVPLDPTTLPEDAVFKGYEEVLIQNLLLKTDNVCFKRATYYSASAGKTYLAPLPPGYEGGFGPDLKALVLSLHHLGNVSQPALHTFLTHAGIRVSTGWIGDFLIAQQEDFHQEKSEIALAGLASSPWVGTDDTATRVNGVNQPCHVLTNPLFTTYTTLEKKDRRAVLTVLHNGQPVPLVLTPEVLTSEAVLSLPAKWQRVLGTWPLNTLFEQATVCDWLDQQMPTLSATARKSLLDTLAIAGYHFQTQVPVVRALVCDDAPQFPGLTADLGLCWVHDGRHYRKLVPHLPLHRQLLEAFLKDYWTYYDRLLAYREHPTSQESQRLRDDFDTLFSPDTGYAHLDFRIQQTRANKDKLLLVLSPPELPLHNNASEWAVRRRVRKRDVSFGARSEAGVRAGDTFQTLAATAQKLGVSFIAYVADRVSGRREMPSLASLITERASQMDLGASWA
jgi:hypothetical protein